MSGTSSASSSSLAKGLRVLDALVESGDALSLTELSQRLQMHKTSVYRFLTALVRAGYVAIDRESRRYRAGLKILHLSAAILGALELPRVADPFLVDLSSSCGEAASVGVVDGTEIVIVGRVMPKQRITANFPVGTRLPIHCTSMGKSILANLPRQTARKLLESGGMSPVTDHTITNSALLELQLDAIQVQGYGTNDQESAIGLRSVAAPVFDMLGAAIGAVNVSAPVARVTAGTLVKVFAPRVMRTAREISAELGYRCPPTSVASNPISEGATS